MPTHERHLRLNARIEFVRKACQFVVKAAQDAGFDAESIFQIQLSVEEIYTNIIEHGYGKEDDDNYIDLIITITATHLIIQIVDQAPRFNPLIIPPPDPHAELQERDIGGWGIHFVRQYMDKIIYQYADQQNCLILEKARPV